MSTQTQSPGKHVDPIELMMEMLSKIDPGSGKYDSEDQSLFYLIAQLIAKMEGLSSEVANIGTESNAFSTVQKDEQKVTSDIHRIQKWVADWKAAHGGKDPTPGDALTDKEYMADVKQFSDDMKKYHDDAQKYNFIEKYRKDGMDEGAASANMIWGDDTIPGSQGSIGDMINNGDLNHLGAALLTAATKSTDTSGTFYDWSNGKAGISVGLNGVEQDFGMWVSNWNQTLNVDGTYLQQIQQTGQNDISSLNSMMNMIIQNLRAG